VTEIARPPAAPAARVGCPDARRASCSAPPGRIRRQATTPPRWTTSRSGRRQQAGALQHFRASWSSTGAADTYATSCSTLRSALEETANTSTAAGAVTAYFDFVAARVRRSAGVRVDCAASGDAPCWTVLSQCIDVVPSRETDAGWTGRAAARRRHGRAEPVAGSTGWTRQRCRGTRPSSHVRLAWRG